MADLSYRYGATQEGVVHIDAPSATESGEVIVRGSGIAVSVPLNTPETGDKVAYRVEGVHEGAAQSGAWSDGDVLYWDNGAKELTTTAASNATAGVAVGDKGAGILIGRVDINA